MRTRTMALIFAACLAAAAVWAATVACSDPGADSCASVTGVATIIAVPGLVTAIVVIAVAELLRRAFTATRSGRG